MPKTKRKRLTPLQLASANRIKAMREARGLTKERFAGELGTTLNTINRWENGAIPSAVWQRELTRFEERVNEG